MTPTIGSLWSVNGTTYRVESLDNGAAHYPITLVPVERSPQSLAEIDRFVRDNRLTAENEAKARAIFAGPMTVELRWFERVDVREVTE